MQYGLAEMRVSVACNVKFTLRKVCFTSIGYTRLLQMSSMLYILLTHGDEVIGSFWTKCIKWSIDSVLGVIMGYYTGK